jgi:hypothetical protein
MTAAVAVRIRAHGAADDAGLDESVHALSDETAAHSRKAGAVRDEMMTLWSDCE